MDAKYQNGKGLNEERWCYRAGFARIAGLAVTRVVVDEICTVVCIISASIQTVVRISFTKWTYDYEKYIMIL